jgi:hypothetical protein
LTEEEKAAKLAAYKEKVERIKKERQLQEKQDECVTDRHPPLPLTICPSLPPPPLSLFSIVPRIKREKERRERGQMINQTEEERARNLRKIEAEKVKREKLAEKVERERIKAELARDKELRKLNNGVLPSVLGVEGYNPSAVHVNKSETKRTREEDAVDPPATSVRVESASSSTGTSTPNPTDANPVKKSTAMPRTATASSQQPELSDQAREEIIDNSIATIGRYRTGGDGGNAFNLLLLFLRNIRDNPSEPKSVLSCALSLL